jgi:hypothetical protein
MAVFVVLCCVFWNGHEVLAADTSCSREATTKSDAAVGPTDYTIVNRTPIALTVYWIDYEGRRRRWYEVAPGASHTHRGAYSTHPFLAADPAGNCIRIFNPPGEIIVSEADLATRGQAAAQSLQDLQRKRLEEGEGAQRQIKAREEAEEFVRAKFVSTVWFDVMARLKQSGLQFTSLDGSDFHHDWRHCGDSRPGGVGRQQDFYSRVLGGAQAPPRDKAEFLWFIWNPFAPASFCDGVMFAPREGQIVTLRVSTRPDNVGRMCDTGVIAAVGSPMLPFASKNLPPVTFAFPCGDAEQVLATKKEEIYGLVDKAVRSALSR